MAAVAHVELVGAGNSALKVPAPSRPASARNVVTMDAVENAGPVGARNPAKMISVRSMAATGRSVGTMDAAMTAACAPVLRTSAPMGCASAFRFAMASSVVLMDAVENAEPVSKERRAMAPPVRRTALPGPEAHSLRLRGFQIRQSPTRTV